ncbi:MAG: VOC family protein [Pseudomonadota bacterium]
MQLHALHHAGLSVSDFDAAVDWWSTHFGFALQREWGGPDLRMGILGAGDIRLELFARPDAAPGPDETRGLVESFDQRGWKHVAFAVPDVDAAIGELREAGIPILCEPTSNPAAGLRYAFLRDPDGNHVELLTPL